MAAQTAAGSGMQLPPIVLDLGTGFIKAGYAGQPLPEHQFPAIVGRPMVSVEERSDTYNGVEIKDLMVGEEAAAVRAMLKITYPMKNGIVQPDQWDNLVHLLDYTFYQKLKIDTTGRKILVTEQPSNPLKNREEICRVMFDRYHFGAVFIGVQSVMALSSADAKDQAEDESELRLEREKKSSLREALNEENAREPRDEDRIQQIKNELNDLKEQGLVRERRHNESMLTAVMVDSGDGATHVVPVYKGHVEFQRVRRLDVAGQDVISKMVDLLGARGYPFNRTADFETVRQIKDKLCYVSNDLKLDEKLAHDTIVLCESYTLPDGRVVQMDSERFLAPECMFQPYLVGKESVGLGELVFNTIRKTARDNQADYWQNIVLSGGSSMYPGLPSRLEKEIRQLWYHEVVLQEKNRDDPAKEAQRRHTRMAAFKVRVMASPRRMHLVFSGSSTFANLFQDALQYWLTKETWDESGVAAVKEKFYRG